jgi:hypothetical protein
MGIARVAIASCYCDEMNEAIVRYFRRFEIDAVPFGGFRSGGTEQDLYMTSLSALDAVGNAEVYRYIAAIAFARLMRPVDGIYTMAAVGMPLPPSTSWSGTLGPG